MHSRRLFAALATGLFLAALVTAALAWGRAERAHERMLYWRTLTLAADVCLASVPAGLLLAMLLLRTKLPARPIWLLLLMAQIFVPLYLQAAAWEAGFGRLGWYTVGTARVDRPLLSGFTGAWWAHVCASIPWNTLFIGIGLLASDRDAEEAALLDASPGRVLRHVTIGWIVPWAMVAALWTATIVATEMTAADLYLVDTYAREIYTGFALNWDFREALVRCWGAILLTAELVAFGLLVAVGFSPRLRSGTTYGPTRALPLARSKWASLTLVILWFAVFAALPWGNLAYQAGVRYHAGAATWSVSRLGLSIVNGLGEFKTELYWSYLIGAATVVCTLPIAALLASAMGWSRLGAMFVISLLAVLLAIPGPLLGLGLVYVLSQPAQGWLAWLSSHSILGPVVAATLKSLPWTTLVLWFAFRSIPQEQFELAQLEGAGPWRRFIHVAVRQKSSAFLLAALVCFALAIGELAAAILVAPPAIPTIATRIFSLIHAGVRDKEASLALLNVMSCLALATLAMGLKRRAESREQKAR